MAKLSAGRPAFVSTRSRLEKLGAKPGLAVAILNLGDVAFRDELDAAGVAVSKATSEFDLLFYGADSEGELALIGDLAPRLAARGAIWVISLKGKLARIRDVQVLAAARACGLVDNKVCAFSETRTALVVRRRASRLDLSCPACPAAG